MKSEVCARVLNTEPVMHTESPLSERASAVLYAVVTEFIASGEPVGSKTLSTRYGFEISTASIRNVLKELEEEGYLSQPHISAGRVPTERAFRLFIDALMRLRQVSAVDRERIQAFFSQPVERSERVRKAGKLLSELSGVPAIILQNRSESRCVKKLRFIPTGPGQLLAVIVLDDDSVENRFIHQEPALEGSQLERLHHLLDEVTSGRTLQDLRLHMGELARREYDEMAVFHQWGESLMRSALQGLEGSQEVIIEGRMSLLREAEDPERMKRLLLALEDRQQLIQLLDGTLNSSRVQVFLGNENNEPTGSPLSVVAASYRKEDHSVAGAMGVLGPTRMDYPGLVPLVGAMAEGMSQALGYDREKHVAEAADDLEEE